MKAQDYLCIGTSFVENIFFTGAVLGWPSLQYVLLKENYFGELCRQEESNSSVSNNFSHHESNHLDDNEIIFCPGRDATLNLALTLAFSFQYIASYFSGIILDKYGTWTYRTIASISIFMAYILLAVSSKESSWLVYLSVLFLSSGGLSIGISNVQTANLAGPLKGMVVSLQTGTFVAAAVVFLIVKEAHDLGVSLRAIFLALALLSTITLVRTFALMPKTFFPCPLPRSEFKYGWKEWSCFKTPPFSDQKECQDQDSVLEAPLQKKSSIDSSNPAVIDKFEQRQKYESFRKSTKSLVFWTNLLTFCIGHMRQNFYIGAFVNWVESFDKENLKSSVNLFNVFFLLGVIASPLCGLLFDAVAKYYRKRLNSVWLTNIRASFIVMLVNSTLLTLVSVLVIFQQVLTSNLFIVLSQFFVYGGNWTLLSVTFPMKHYGKLLGITQVSASVTSLLSYGVFRLALMYDSHFFYSNIGMLILSLITFVHPLVLYKKAYYK